MDIPRNHDYGRQGEFQATNATNTGYLSHAAEGNGDEEWRGEEEGRRVHRHAYLEERPYRRSSSVEFSYPNEGEYCEFSSALSRSSWESQGADEETL
jgi:hypothetical protein